MYTRLISCLLATAILPNVALAGSSGYALRQRSGILSKQHRRALKVKRQNDAQSSLDLDPSQLMPNQQLTGQETPAAGQVDSLTSVNGFINYCLTQDVPLTDGKQIPGGSCNQTPIGEIIATDKMPSAIFTSPTNGGTIKSNTDFTITMAFQNIATGNKVNTKNSWMAAPQQLDSSGVVLGYSNFIIEEISALDSTTPLDTSKFAFFKAVSTKAQGGVLSTTVKGGLPKGIYKVSSNNVAANGMPVLVAVAQHGTLDACNYFFVTDDGKAVEIPSLSGNATASASASATETASEIATDVSATATATDSAVTDTATATGAAETATATASDASATATDASETATEADTSAAATATASSVTTRRGRGGGKNRTSQAAAATSTASEAAAETSAAATSSEAAAATSEAASTTEEASASEASSAAEETQTTGGRRGGGRNRDGQN